MRVLLEATGHGCRARHALSQRLRMWELDYRIYKPWQAAGEGRTSAVSGGEGDLADMLAGFHQGVRDGRLPEGKCLVDYGFNLSLGDERPDLLEELGGDGTLLRRGAWPQGRAGDGQPLAHDDVEVERDLAAFEKGDLHQPPLGVEHGQVAGEVAAADHVEHGIGAAGGFGDDVDEVLLPGVDRPLGT